jgi:hypothetical protein
VPGSFSVKRFQEFLLFRQWKRFQPADSISASVLTVKKHTGWPSIATNGCRSLSVFMKLPAERVIHDALDRLPLFPYSLSESSSSDEPSITDLSRVSKIKLAALIYCRSLSTSCLIWSKAEILRIQASSSNSAIFNLPWVGRRKSSSTSKS